jgi:hypothetical protein
MVYFVLPHALSAEVEASVNFSVYVVVILPEDG